MGVTFIEGCAIATVDDTRRELADGPRVGLVHPGVDGELLEVERDDFIHMTPYCPQRFTATAREPAEYLLDKDVWRDGS